MLFCAGKHKVLLKIVRSIIIYCCCTWMRNFTLKSEVEKLFSVFWNNIVALRAIPHILNFKNMRYSTQSQGFWFFITDLLENPILGCSVQKVKLGMCR